MRTNVLGLAAAMLSAAMTTMISMPASAGFTLGTDFTYQGRLELAGDVVDGLADFQFRLFNSPEGTGQVGSTYAISEVDVNNGVFTVPVDFGSNAFNGDGRWLEIAVRSPAGSGNFVILTPRQYISATPYSILSLKPWGKNGNSTFYTDGNVGIGTTNPNGRFDVRSGNSSYWQIDSTNGDLHTNGGSDGVAGIYNDSNSTIARTELIVGGQPRLVANKFGAVGVGTTDPLRRFTVLDNNLFTARFENTHPVAAVVEFSNPTTAATWELGVVGSEHTAGMDPGAMYFFKQGAAEVAMTIGPNQRIGMGVNDPAFRLDLPNFGTVDGRARANQWVTYSSERWKENVRPIDNALDVVKQLRGVSFDWKKEHGGTHDLGFVAEEVGKVVPELVTWEADGEWAQGLAYDRITALTVEAIKEQQAQIDALQQDNDELRKQVALLMQRTAELNGAVAKR